MSKNETVTYPEMPYIDVLVIKKFIKKYGTHQVFKAVWQLSDDDEVLIDDMKILMKGFSDINRSNKSNNDDYVSQPTKSN